MDIDLLQDPRSGLWDAEVFNCLVGRKQKIVLGCKTHEQAAKKACKWVRDRWPERNCRVIKIQPALFVLGDTDGP